MEAEGVEGVEAVEAVQGYMQAYAQTQAHTSHRPRLTP